MKHSSHRSGVLLLPLLIAGTPIGCDSSYLEFELNGDVVGQGLHVSGSVRFVECTAHLGPDDCVGETVPIESIGTNDSIELVSVREDHHFTVLAHELGTGRVNVGTANGDACARFDIVPIRETVLELNYDTFPRNLNRRNMRFLTHSIIGVRQEHRGVVNGGDFEGQLGGVSGFVLDADGLEATLDASMPRVGRRALVKTGGIPGQAVLSTEVGGGFDIDIVEQSSIASLQWFASSLRERREELVLRTALGGAIVAMTNNGDTVIGLGERTLEVSADPPERFEVEVHEPVIWSLHPQISLRRLEPGDGVVSLTWEGVTLELPIIDPAAEIGSE